MGEKIISRRSSCERQRGGQYLWDTRNGVAIRSAIESEGRIIGRGGMEEGGQDVGRGGSRGKKKGRTAPIALRGKEESRKTENVIDVEKKSMKGN